MKNSFVKWIGQIPDSWGAKTIRECLIERIEKNKDLQENTILSLSAKDGVSLYDGENHSGNKPKEDLSDYKIVRENDIVANSMNILSGSVGLSQYNGVVSPVYYIYHIRHKDDNIRFFNYIFQCQEFQKNLRRLGKGILIKETEDGKLNTIRTKVPSKQLSLEKIPYCEPVLQNKIVAFLDKKCSEIDQLIEIENQQIEKLKEYKQSIITEAVTKGLDKSAKMKDSGIKNMGLINFDYKITSIKFICPIVTDYVASGSFADLAKNVTYLDYPDYAMLVRTIDISNKGYQSEKVYINEHSYNFLKNSNLFGGEIILPNIGASVGDIYLVPKLYDKMSLAPNSIMIKTNQNDKYYYYYFLSKYGRYSIINLSQSAAQPKFNKTDFKELKVIYPFLEEQDKIVKYLDKKCSEIDSLIGIKNKKIEELQEYKKSIIYEYVTGKKEVI